MTMFQLHHIGYLVKDMAVSAASFAARFEYTIESDVIEDPRQTARVQFLRQPGAMHWLELITPTGPGSKLYNALAKGEGLHHLCYEVPSLEAAGQQLREQHMLPLGKAQSATAFPGEIDRLVHGSWFATDRTIGSRPGHAVAGEFSTCGKEIRHDGSRTAENHRDGHFD